MTLTCSCTSSYSEFSSSMKMGTAPVSITTLVCKKVPEAMLVSAQAASNCYEHTVDNMTTTTVLPDTTGGSMLTIAV